MIARVTFYTMLIQTCLLTCRRIRHNKPDITMDAKISQDLNRKIKINVISTSMQLKLHEISEHRPKDLQRLLNCLATILVSVDPHKRWVAENAIVVK